MYNKTQKQTALPTTCQPALGKRFQFTTTSSKCLHKLCRPIAHQRATTFANRGDPPSSMSKEVSFVTQPCASNAQRRHASLQHRERGGERPHTWIATGVSSSQPFVVTDVHVCEEFSWRTTGDLVVCVRQENGDLVVCGVYFGLKYY